jgi:hypothetical protein
MIALVLHFPSDSAEFIALNERLDRVGASLNGMSFNGDLSDLTDVVEILEDLVQLGRRAKASARHRDDHPGPPAELEK